LKNNDNYVVAVYNPSLTSKDTITIRTDLRKASVKVWQNDKFISTQGFDLLCEDFTPKLMLVNDCELKVRTTIDPFETKFFLITPELDVESVPPTESKFVNQASLKNDAWTMKLSRSGDSKSLSVEIFKTKGGKITN